MCRNFGFLSHNVLFSGVSFIRSGEKVDCKKWYEGEKSFIKIESLEVAYVYL